MPTSTVRPSTVARTPWPVTESNVGRLRDASDPARLAPATTASPSGCSEDRSAEATRRSRSSASTSPSGDHVGEGGLAPGDRPGLVEDDRVELLGRLQRLGRADEDAVAGALAGADHDRQRRGQAEGAGAGDDQHGHRGHQRRG